MYQCYTNCGAFHWWKITSPSLPPTMYTVHSPGVGVISRCIKGGGQNQRRCCSGGRHACKLQRRRMLRDKCGVSVWGIAYAYWWGRIDGRIEEVVARRRFSVGGRGLSNMEGLCRMRCRMVRRILVTSTSRRRRTEKFISTYQMSG
jgi:hypothetical protein